MEKMIITIGRQFGSRGREVGIQLAEELGIEYYGKELTDVAAENSGLNAEFLNGYDEKRGSSFLYSLVLGHTGMFTGNYGGLSVELMAAQAHRDAVVDVASKGSCVIVGRCADYILRDEPNLLRVFICADTEDRVKRIAERENISESKALDRIRKVDKERSSYYNYTTDQKWGDSTSYDLCINTSRCGIDGAVKAIKDFIEISKKVK